MFSWWIVSCLWGTSEVSAPPAISFIDCGEETIKMVESWIRSSLVLWWKYEMLCSLWYLISRAWLQRYETNFHAQFRWAWRFFLLMNLRLLPIASSFLLNITEHENFSANKYENAYCWHLPIYKHRKFHAQLNWAWKKFNNLGGLDHFLDFCRQDQWSLLHRVRGGIGQIVSYFSIITLGTQKRIGLLCPPMKKTYPKNSFLEK